MQEFLRFYYTNLDVWFCDLFYNAMEEPLIRDIPTIKKNLELVKGMKSLKAIMPVLKPAATAWL